MPQLSLVLRIPDDLIRRIGRDNHKQHVATALKLRGVSEITLQTTSLGPDITHEFIIRGTTAKALIEACDSLEPIEEFIMIPEAVFRKFKDNKDKLLNEIRASSGARINPEGCSGLIRSLRVLGLIENVRKAKVRIDSVVTHLGYESLSVPPILPTQVVNSGTSNLPDAIWDAEFTRGHHPGPSSQATVFSALPKPKSEQTTLLVDIPSDLIECVGASHDRNVKAARKLPFISAITCQPCSNKWDPMCRYAIRSRNTDALNKARECFELIQEVVQISFVDYHRLAARQGELLEEIQTSSGAVIQPEAATVSVILLRLIGTRKNVATAIFLILVGASTNQRKNARKGHEVGSVPSTSQNSQASQGKPDKEPDYTLVVQVPHDLMRRLGGQQMRVAEARKLPGISSITCMAPVVGAPGQGFVVRGTSADALNNARDQIQLVRELARIPFKDFRHFTENIERLLNDIQASDGVAIIPELDSVEMLSVVVIGLVGNVSNALARIATELSLLDIAPTAPPRSKNASVANEKECIICADALSTTAFIPCGHKNFCQKCAENEFKERKICPCCRSAIVLVQRIYD